MQTIRRRSGIRRGGIIYLPADEIEESCVRFRTHLDDDDIHELAQSIAEYGILNPLTVRLRDDRYELIAGERRLRAARLAGISELPCILLEVGMEELSLIALTENLQRRELDLADEARGIRRLIDLFGMSQEEAARRLGRSQSEVADKLSLLTLPADILDGLCGAGLNERHGRALLRLSDPEAQRTALRYMAERGLSAAAAEEYIESLIKEMREPKRVFIMKNVRIFVNSVRHGVELMRQGGIDASLRQEETDDTLLLTITVPKRE